MIYNIHSSRRLFPFLLFFIFSACLYKLLSFRGPIHIFSSTPPPSPPTINLVLATTLGRDYTWTESISYPDLIIFPYMADSPSALYHPPINKGHEALVYLTYITSHYDNLSDVTIFTHGDDYTWHVDSALKYSTLTAINMLSLEEVQKQGYVNLRTGWKNACPNWINTTITVESPLFDPGKSEEPLVADAFKATFPDDTVPEILAQPCCSQFAVSKEAVLRNGKEVYERGMQWLMDTSLPDELSGRIWEHFWQYLLGGKGVWCPEEWSTLCRNFHVCFESQGDYEAWVKVEKKKNELNDLKYLYESGQKEGGPEELLEVKRKMSKLEETVGPWRDMAVKRGRNEASRKKILGER